MLSIHVSISIYIYLYLSSLYFYRSICICVFVHIHRSIHEYLSMCIYLSISTSISVYFYIFLSISLFLSLYVYIYTYIMGCAGDLLGRNVAHVRHCLVQVPRYHLSSIHSSGFLVSGFWCMVHGSWCRDGQGVWGRVYDYEKSDLWFMV